MTQTPVHSDVEKLLEAFIDTVRSEPNWIDQICLFTAEDKMLCEVALDDVRYAIHITRSSPVPRHPNLSPREQEIIRLIAQGLPNKAIALQLEISPCTVGTYMRRIFNKLCVRSRSELVAKTVASSLIYQ
ncbi:MAG: response regulator transcription factor [Anaerolineae bacterium]|nr:response regulator transcription factor [Anaerolineae bacterium]